MQPDLPFSDDLARRLPLPLAQLYRRAHNAKNPLDRCLTAYYLWEASLKLLASVAVCLYAERPEPEAALVEVLQNLARPSLGHWWEFLRRLTPVLADGGEPAFVAVRDLVLGRSRDDLPHAAGLDALLIEDLEGQAAARSTVRISELFDRLVRYRNREVGHGAAGQRPASFYERLGRALLLGLPELLRRLDVLAGRQLIYVPEVRREPGGTWLVERFELMGENVRRVPSLEVPEGETGSLPLPQCVYLQDSNPGVPVGAAAGLVALHPLVVCDFEVGEVLFLNARRGRRRIEYICYGSGRVAERSDLAGACRALLARVLSMPVDEGAVEQWATRSQAEEGPQAGGASKGQGLDAVRQLGEFELLSELGRGGMGVVYRAWQPSLGRQVALKSLFRSGDDKSEIRFAREIRALGRVEHPNLVKIYTSGSAGDQWFYAMELLEGATLEAVCKQLQGRIAPDALDVPTWQGTVSTTCEESRRQEKRFSAGSAEPPPRSSPSVAIAGLRRGAPILGRSYCRHVAELMQQVAEATNALHEAGVIHRDIKPGNIMVSTDGALAVLMDLGLARLADETEGRLTRTRQFVGTLRYASPEQVLAVGALDRRSDIYSLGATLWELLTLRPMFGATEQTPTPDLMQRIQYEEPERVGKYHPGIPRDLEAVCLKCLEKDPARRYGTAAELADELRRFLDGEPVQARSVGQVERCWRWCRRHPAPVAAGLLAVFAVLAGVALLIGGLFAAEKARSAENLQRERDQKEEARAQAEQYRLEAQRLSALLTLKNGAALCESGDAGPGMLWMARSLAVCPDSAANLKRAIRTALSSAQSTLHTLQTVYTSPGATIVAAFSPDGKTLLFGGKDAYLIDVASGRQRGVVQRAAGEVSGGGFSPDGRSFVTSTMRGAIRVADASTGEDIGPAIQHRGTVKSVAFSPDGNRLLVAASSDRPSTEERPPSLQCYEAHSRQPVGPTFACKDNLYAAVWSPNGLRVATAAMETNARVWDAQTGQPLCEPLKHPGVVFTVAFSPDGKTLLTGCLDGGARFWEIESGKPFGPTLRHKGPVRSTAFSRDGRLVLTSSEDGSARLWEAATGRSVGQLLAHPSELRHALFSPDESHILTAGFERTARLWRVAAEQAQARVLPNPGAVAVAAFSPDGRTVLTGCQQSDRPGESRLWDAVTGAPLGPPLSQQGQVMAAAFSPDGKLVLTGGNDRTARLWKTADSSPAHPPWPYDNVVGAVAFSPDGRLAAVGGRGGVVHLYEVASGNRIADWQAYNRQGLWVWGLTFTPDGQHLLTAGGLAARLWSVPDGRPVGEEMKHVNEARTAVLSPDAAVVLTCSHDKTARLWSAADGRPLSPPLPHKGEVRAGAFRPDGKMVATASADGTVRLWEVPSGRSLAPPLFHDGWVRSVAFSTDGKTLASGCDDGTARLWSADDGAPLGAVLQHRGPVNRVAFSPDGLTVLTASSDGTARLWRPPPPVGGDPAQVALWAEVLTGMELDAEGTVQILPGAVWQERRQQLQARGGPPLARP